MRHDLLEAIAHTDEATNQECRQMSIQASSVPQQGYFTHMGFKKVNTRAVTMT